MLCGGLNKIIFFDLLLHFLFIANSPGSIQASVCVYPHFSSSAWYGGIASRNSSWLVDNHWYILKHPWWLVAPVTVIHWLVSRLSVGLMCPIAEVQSHTQKVNLGQAHFNGDVEVVVFKECGDGFPQLLCLPRGGICYSQPIITVYNGLEIYCVH